ncbi:unnamed protein product [Calypogeia fissa]
MDSDGSEITMSTPISAFYRGVDRQGNCINGKLSGRWTATIFLFVYEAWERMAWLMVASSLVQYLQSNMRESHKSATRNASNWVAVSHITSIIGGFVADAYLGYFRTIWLFSGVSILGFLLITMAASIPSLDPSVCKNSFCLRDPDTVAVIYLFAALYLVTIGTGGVWPALPAFGADQFEDGNSKEQKSRNSFFNWFFFSGALGSLITSTLLTYAKKHMSIAWQFGFSTLSTCMALTVFLLGVSFYRYKQTKDNPLERMAQVIVAAFRKRNVALPEDESRLYEEREIYDHKLAWNEKGAAPAQPCPRKLYHTRGLRCLDKAAVMIGTVRVVDGTARVPASRWNLCSVTQVEELKLILYIAPIWLGTLMFNVVKAQVPTFFVQQGEAMDRSIGKLGGSISSASMQAITSLVIVLTIPGYDLILVPWVQRFTRNKRGFSLLQRMGIGMILSILTTTAAALTEIQRRKHDRLSIFWQCPQYIFEGLGEVFTSVGQLEFFYDQAPDSMRGMGAALYFTNYGVAMFLSNLLSTIVNTATTRNNHPGWVKSTHVDRERLDLYYWVLVALGGVNFIFYMISARWYSYKKVDTRVFVTDSRSFEWNMSELGLMQKPTLFKHISSLKAVMEEEKEEERTPEESPLKSSNYTSSGGSSRS